jgi:hypothetical protein
MKTRKSYNKKRGSVRKTQHKKRSLTKKTQHKRKIHHVRKTKRKRVGGDAFTGNNPMIKLKHSQSVNSGNKKPFFTFPFFKTSSINVSQPPPPQHPLRLPKREVKYTNLTKEKIDDLMEMAYEYIKTNYDCNNRNYKNNRDSCNKNQKQTNINFGQIIREYTTYVVGQEGIKQQASIIVNTALKIASSNDNELMKNFIKKYDDDIKTDNPNMYGVFEEYYNLLTKPTPPQIHYSNPEPEPESESEPEPESESESEPESEPSDPSEVLSPEEIKEANNEEELYEEPE